MSVEFRDPPGLADVPIYHQVAIATGTRLVFVAGQIASGPDGGLVGRDDLETQVEQAYLNVHTALTSAGASFDDVAKVTLYVVAWSPEKMGALVAGIERASTRLGIPVPRPPLTGIGVPALAEPNALVEVEAVAVLA